MRCWKAKTGQQDKEGGAKLVSTWRVGPLFFSISAKQKRPIQRKHMRKSCVPLNRSHPAYPAARACQGWPHGFLGIPVRYPFSGTITRPIMAIQFLNALQASVLAHGPTVPWPGPFQSLFSRTTLIWALSCSRTLGTITPAPTAARSSFLLIYVDKSQPWPWLFFWCVQTRHDLFHWANLATHQRLKGAHSPRVPNNAAGPLANVCLLALLKAWETMFTLNDSRRLGWSKRAFIICFKGYR